MSNLYVTVHTGPSPASHGTTFRVDQRFDAVIEALLPDTAVPEAAWLDQARRNAELRARFIESHGALTAEQVADLVGSKALNRRQAAYRLVKDGKLFAVDWHGTLVYPSFQFDPQAGEVRPQIAAVLAALAGELVGWELAHWFDDAVYDPARRSYTVPLDVIDDEAQLVRLAEATIAHRRTTGAA